MMKTMRAWRYDNASAGLEAKEVPVPEPQPGQVVLDVEAAGLCHSDSTIVRGQGEAFLMKRPITLGHEVAGTVRRLGQGVSNVQVGDRVVVAPAAKMVAVEGFHESLGLGMDGGYAEQAVVWAKRLMKLPDHVGFAQAAVSTDAIATAYHAVVAEAEIGASSTAAIVGLGGLGLSGLCIAALQNATVYGVDIDEARFGAAMKNGAKACFTSLDDLAHVDLDVIVDFAGVGFTTAAAIEAVKPTGRVVLVGLGVAKFEISAYSLVLRNVDLRGSLGSTMEEYRAVLNLVADGSLDPLVEEIAFADVPEGLRRLDRGEVTGRLFTRPNA